MKFNIILITDSKYGISKHNKMPWYFSEDLKHFSKITFNNICIMGSTTAKDLGKPLPNRDNIVISSNDDCAKLSNESNDFIIVRSIENALKKAYELTILDKEIFIIGGSKLFNEALKSNNLGKIYYTHINQSYNCDNFVEPLLNRDDMNYEILNKIKVPNKSTLNMMNDEDVELTFYSITKKI
jgi:dihydrofolate reductase